MVTFRCTQKLLARVKDLKSPTDCPQSTTALGEWYCNLVQFGRQQIILCVSEHSYLTVLLPAAPAKTFGYRMCERLENLLDRFGVPQEQIKAEIGEMQVHFYDKTSSRVKVGVMNLIGREVEYYWGESTLDEFFALGEARIADGLYGAPNPIKPKEEATRLLAKKWV